MKRLVAILFISLLFWSSSLSAQQQFETDVSGVGTTVANFLEIGVGARAMAMGGSYVAIANDPTALYYNPAGITNLGNIQVEFMHNEWLVDTNYDFIGAVTPLPFWNSSIGASLILLDYGEQPVRTEEFQEGNGQNYGARDYAVSLTYAAALTTNFSFGLSGKYINQKIWNETAGTMAMDLGIFYTTPVEGLRLGMSISNFGGEMQLSGRDLDTVKDPDEDNENVEDIPVSFITSSYPLPLIFRAGMSYTQSMGPVGSLTVTSDVFHPNNNTESISVGAEYGYAGIFFLRAGYENAYEENAINGLTFGGGIDYYEKGKMGFRVDYAFSDWGILESAHRFSVGIILN